jgi:hypothetical protein
LFVNEAGHAGRLNVFRVRYYRTCSKCRKRRSCGVYRYKFQWDGDLIRQSTKQGNDNDARNQEAGHRARLATERNEKKAKAEQIRRTVAQSARCPECEKWYNSTHFSKASDGQGFCGDACRLMWERKSRKAPEAKSESKKKKQRPPIRPFVLYAFRHTFLTRLGESGCDVWTLARNRRA